MTPIATSLETRFSLDRETMATYSGSLWLTVGRIRQARVAFEQVGHVGQRETNLARLADLVDDKQAMIQHTKRVGWIYNPVPLARAGLFDRARRVMQQPSIGSNVAPAFAIARGLEALARNRLQDAITLLQPAVDRLRGRSDAMFYNASMSLAQAWRGAANPSQAVRVLEETVSQRPAYITPGLSGAWWIKAQVQLLRAYREAGRTHEAEVLERQLRRLLSHADADHPFLEQMKRPGQAPPTNTVAHPTQLARE